MIQSDELKHSDALEALNTPDAPSESLDRVTWIDSRVLDAPTAAVSLTGADR